MVLHHKMKHLPEKYLHRMAEQGLIPKKFRKVKLPSCPACILAKQHKRPWRSKAKRRHIRQKGQIHPGDGCSVDQLESRHPGLVPQTKGFHRTTERYVGATIFVDHATDFTYVHLIPDYCWKNFSRLNVDYCEGANSSKFTNCGHCQDSCGFCRHGQNK